MVANAEHEDEDSEVHSDITASYAIICNHPEDIEHLDMTSLFEQFPNFEELDVQWVSDNGQSAQELTPDDAILDLQ